MAADFADMVGVDSPSLHERAMAELLRGKLAALGFEVFEDGAAAKAGGECGNLIATARGEPGLPAVALLAHMDTVEPCRGKKCVADPGDPDILRSGGDTVLGGDDAAGMLAALEVARRLRERGIRHGDVQIVLTIAEEIGLVGAKCLDLSMLRAEYCFVFDSGTPPGSLVARTPTRASMAFTVLGRAAHAGIEPEKGLSAAKVFAEAVAGMRLGRIDAETTANIGIVRGGDAVNAVCERIVAQCEARGFREAPLRAQMDHMRRRFEDACAKYGARLECEESIDYRGYELGEGDPIVRLLQEAERRRAAAAGEGGASAGGRRPLALLPTGGGSDANILIDRGVTAANLPMGMHDVHSTGEYANLRETDRAAELVLNVFALLAERGTGGDAGASGA
jgi:tripeptide aminopeptidase